MKPLKLPARPDNNTTFQVKPEHVKYAKMTMGLLGLAISVVVIFAVVIGVSAYNIVQTTTPAVRSLTSGKLNRAISEAHLMLKSARHVTDSLPVEDVMQHWKTTNGLLKATNIPWKEVPEWRKFAQRAFEISTKMMKAHPEWSKDIKDSSSNLKSAAEPIASELKEWRGALNSVSKAYAKTLLNVYKLS